MHKVCLLSFIIKDAYMLNPFKTFKDRNMTRRASGTKLHEIFYKFPIIPRERDEASNTPAYSQKSIVFRLWGDCTEMDYR